MNLLAFDYQAQKWVHGEPARALLRCQLEDTLELLRGPKGEEYARSVGRDKAQSITEHEGALAKLEVYQ